MSRSVRMWNRISKYFVNYPARAKIARLILERGFQVKPPYRVVSGEIEIPHTQLAREAGVDRRVIKETVETILSIDELRRIYENLRQSYLLIDVAKHLGMDVIVVVPEDARKPGIVSDVTRKIAERGLSIRQIYTEDPEWSSEPRLIIVVDGRVPSELIDELRRIPEVRRVILQ